MGKRKPAAEIAEEYKKVLALLNDNKSELEITAMLGLTGAQFKSHLFNAMKSGQFIYDGWAPTYELVKAQSLPTSIREKLSVSGQEPLTAESLVKVEASGQGLVTLSVFVGMEPATLCETDDLEDLAARADIDNDEAQRSAIHDPA